MPKPDIPRTVWSYSTGSYSAYQVRALFTTKEAAEAAEYAASTDEEAFVEEFTLYDEVPERVTLYLVREWIGVSGETRDHYEVAETEFPWSIYAAYDPGGRPTVKYDRTDYGGPGGYLVVWGVDRQAVEQAFGDRRGELLAKALEVG